MSSVRFRSLVRTPGRRPGGFTLTELLIVIAIIAVLASLITAAAVNALRRARQGRITLEINQIAGALEQFKTDYGDYPPNGINPSDAQNNPPSGSPAALVQGDFVRMFKKAFPRNQEPPQLILALCGQNTNGRPANLPNGMNAAEALYFWLGGFSSDPKFPISGPGGPSFPNNQIETLESRTVRYQFDLGRLGPRTDDGMFDASEQRFIVYDVDLNGNNTLDAGETRRINFWQYRPSGSEQPLIYVDTSRHKPYQYDPPARIGSAIFALKKVREGFPSSGTPTVGDLTFMDKKFQLLHCGLDDDWGDFGVTATGDPRASLGNQAVFPVGPFIGPIADTLTNFTEGELADAAEQ